MALPCSRGDGTGQFNQKIVSGSSEIRWPQFRAPRSDLTAHSTGPQNDTGARRATMRPSNKDFGSPSQRVYRWNGINRLVKAGAADNNPWRSLPGLFPVPSLRLHLARWPVQVSGQYHSLFACGLVPAKKNNCAGQFRGET